MTLTTNQGGIFTSNGANVYLDLVSGVDWIRVRNLTQGGIIQTVGVGVEYYWQFGMAQNSQWSYYKSNAANATQLIEYVVAGGFQYFNNTINNPGALVTTITAISTAAIPVVTNTGTNGLIPGSVVRLINIVGAQQLGGIDFTVGYNTLSASTFSLDYMVAIAAATTGSFRVIPYNAYFYPSHRVITSISQAAQAVVVFSVTHSYQVGNTLRITVPSAFGMVEMNNLLGTVVAVNNATTGAGANSVTLNINSSAFTAFAWPTSGEYAAFSPAQAVPVGEDTAEANLANVNVLTDGTLNTGSIGVILTGGAGYPGGANNDIMIWEAGTFFNNNSNPNA